MSGVPVSAPAASPPADRDRDAVSVRRWAIVAGAAAAVAAIAAAATLLIPRGGDGGADPVALPAGTVTAAPGQGSVATGAPQASPSASAASPGPSASAPARSAPPSAVTSGPAAPPAGGAVFAVPRTLCPAVRYGAVTALVGEQVSAPVRSGADPNDPQLRTCQVDYVTGGFQALAISFAGESGGRDYMASAREFEASGGGIPNARPELTERDAGALGVGQEAFSFASESPDGTRAGLVIRNANLVMEFEIYGYDALVKDRGKRAAITNAMARAVRETLPQLH